MNLRNVLLGFVSLGTGLAMGAFVIFPWAVLLVIFAFAVVGANSALNMAPALDWIGKHLAPIAVRQIQGSSLEVNGILFLLSVILLFVAALLFQIELDRLKKA